MFTVILNEFAYAGNRDAVSHHFHGQKKNMLVQADMWACLAFVCAEISFPPHKESTNCRCCLNLPGWCQQEELVKEKWVCSTSCASLIFDTGCLATSLFTHDGVTSSQFWNGQFSDFATTLQFCNSRLHPIFLVVMNLGIDVCHDNDIPAHGAEETSTRFAKLDLGTAVLMSISEPDAYWGGEETMCVTSCRGIILLFLGGGSIT